MFKKKKRYCNFKIEKKLDFWNKWNICFDFFVNLYVFVMKKNGLYILIKYLIIIYDIR